MTARRLSTMGNKKRRRRTKAQMQEIRDAIWEVVEEEHPTSIRHVFYRVAMAGIVEKTEGECKSTINRLITEMRREGVIPWSWITDGTRLRRKPRSYESLSDALWDTQQTYRRALWADQDAYVEIWSEKEAIAGILLDVTIEWDVPLLVCKGQPSLTYLYNAAEEIKAVGKPAYLYYFGDWDPGGLRISRKTEEQLRGFLRSTEFRFERVAVTREQIDEWNLPTRATKDSDPEAHMFEGDSVEVDAISPAALRRIARECIERHVDPDALERTRLIERVERETLTNMVIKHGGGAS